MPETTAENPFLTNLSTELVIGDYTAAQLVELRSKDFVELPYAGRLDQLIEALPATSTSLLITMLTSGQALGEAFAPAGDMKARRNDLVKRTQVLICAAACHVSAELNLRIPPRKKA